MDDRQPGWDAEPGRALVIGAGGAARAVVHGLLDRGFQVAVANRTAERAEALAQRAGRGTRGHGLRDVDRLAAGAGVIVNTTAAELHGADLLPISWDEIGTESIAADIVYVPLETPFLAAARARGLRTVDGLGMLLHQAVPGFELWFGRRPVVTADLRALVEKDISG